MSRNSNDRPIQALRVPAPQMVEVRAPPWHFDFYKGKKFRFSLDVIAKARDEKPPRTKGDAEALADRIRSETKRCARHGALKRPGSPLS